MPEVEVKNLNNQVVEKLVLSDEVFHAKINYPLVWEAIRHYQAQQRRGTASTKTRGEVKGSGRKPWRQKGTGRARVGSIRSPLWRHGGTVHGPKPRDYTYAFPKKKLRGAMRSVLTERLQENRLVVIDQFNLDSHKTREFKKVLDTFGIADREGGKRKLLIVDSTSNRNLLLGSRNLPHVDLVGHERLNIYDLVNHELIFFSKDAILKVQERLGR